MRYRVSMPEPHSHLFHVDMEVDRPGAEAVLAMPVWTPGSYLVREFARHLEGIEAEDASGRHLSLARLDKHRFRAAAGGTERLRVRYRVYANELTVRTCHLDGEHGYFNGAALFLYPEGRLSEPCELEIVPPEGWAVATALDGGPARFVARDYEELVDSPVEVGTHRTASFTVLGRPHTLAVAGRGNVDAPRFAEDLRRVVETSGALLGGPLPYDRYLFIVHLTEKRKGGLEHARSTTLNVQRMGFHPRESYEEVLSLAAHEHLHAWNAKRLRPAVLLPYDYSREQYTRLLWWFEGVTSYYDRLLLLRAGLCQVPSYLKHLGEELTALGRTPGARKMSLEEASLTAWVKYYRPDENTPNSAVSYYLKGALVALQLDLVLRRAGRSLDELLRLLVQRHAERGLPEDGVERAVAEMMGEPAARAFFDGHVRGTEQLAPDLGAVGLKVGHRTAQSLDDKGGTPPRKNDKPSPGWLGAEIPGGQKLVVGTVRDGGPAHRAGLYAGDEIVAESGFRLDRAALWDRLCERGPQGRVYLTIFRKDELLEVKVPLAEPPIDTIWVEPDPQAGSAERAAFEAWSGAPWPRG